MNIDSGLSGIDAIFDVVEEYDLSMIYAYDYSEININALGDVGMEASNITLYSPEKVIVNAPQSKFAIYVGTYGSIELVPGEISLGLNNPIIEAFTTNGVGIETSTLQIYHFGSSVKGETKTGFAGINARSSMDIGGSSARPITVEGYGFKHGIVTQNYSDFDFPSGSMSVTDARIYGHAEEGMGISTNMVSVYSTDYSTYVASMEGVAEKGIGISVCMMSLSGSDVVGTSNGTTASHFQVYGSIPDSAGISILTSLSVYDGSTVIAKAPQDVPGSYGLHVFFKHATQPEEPEYLKPYGSGYISFYGENPAQNPQITAEGETGLFAKAIEGGVAGVVIDVVGKIDGSILGSFSYYTSDFNDTGITLNTVGAEGTGLEMGHFYQSSVTLSNLTINATGGKRGIYIDLPDATIENATISAVATDTDGVGF